MFYKIITNQNRNMDFMPESETVLEIKIPSSPASGFNRFTLQWDFILYINYCLGAYVV